jgi:regulator of protease activity HflC (stomatin/prohibitin superfamily)
MMQSPSDPLSKNQSPLDAVEFDYSKLSARDQKLIKPYTTDQADYVDCWMSCIGNCWKIICCPFAYCDCGPVRHIPENHDGLVLSMGRYSKKLGPGIQTVNPCSETLIIVDLRATTLDIKPQILLTKDNVNITVDAYCQYQVRIPELAAFKVKDAQRMIAFMIEGTLKTIFCLHSLQEVLQDRKKIEKIISDIIDDATDPFGIQVLHVGIQKLSLPKSLEEAMASVAESENQKAAKIIDAQANFDAAKIWRASADELSKNMVSLQLHYWEVLKEVSSENNTTILMPNELLNSIKG